MDNVWIEICGNSQDKSINPYLQSRRHSSCGTMILLSVSPSITICLYRTHPPCAVLYCPLTMVDDVIFFCLATTDGFYFCSSHPTAFTIIVYRKFFITYRYRNDISIIGHISRCIHLIWWLFLNIQTDTCKQGRTGYFWFMMQN